MPTRCTPSRQSSPRMRRTVTTYDLLKRDWRPDVPGLLDVTVKDIRAMKLDELRAVAKRAGLHPSWHGHTRKKELIDAVVARRKEHATFAKAVKSHGREKALQRGREEIEHAAHHGKQLFPGVNGAISRGRRERLAGDLIDAMTAAMEACVHIVPSGSGVRCGPRGKFVLTCAHCVVWDGEGDDWGEESYYDADKDGERYIVGSTTRRVGRMVTVVDVHGKHGGAVCVYHCDKFDLALLKIVDGPLATGSAEIVGLSIGCFGSTDVGEQAKDKTPVVCIGNPFDVDLECPEGEEPEPMEHTPFWVSAGVLQGDLLTWEESAAKENVGRLRHSCWTYWGHSGAPLIRASESKIDVVGLHNSWDDTNRGQRHAVSLEDIQEFIQEFLDNDCLHNDCLDAEWQIGKYKGQIRDDSESGSDEYDEYKDFGRSMSRSPPRQPIY